MRIQKEADKSSSYHELPKLPKNELDIQREVMDNAPLSGKDEDGISGYVPYSFYTDYQ